MGEGEQRAHEDLATYKVSVQKVVTHLAQTASLVVRRRLSIDVAYDVLGTQVLAAGDDLRNLLKMGFAHTSGCVAPGQMERALWKRKSAEEINDRIGWGDFLDLSRGTAERVALLQDLLMVQAMRVDDLDPLTNRNSNMGARGAALAHVDRLAICWRASRRFGLLRAVRLVASVASAGQARARMYKWAYPRWLQSLWSRLFEYRGLPFNGWLKRPVDALVLPWLLARAVVRARTVGDVRRLPPPQRADDGLSAADLSEPDLERV